MQKKEYVRFLESASLHPVQGPHYEKGELYHLRLDQAQRWIRRGKAEVAVCPETGGFLVPSELGGDVEKSLEGDGATSDGEKPSPDDGKAKPVVEAGLDGEKADADKSKDDDNASKPAAAVAGSKKKLAGASAAAKAKAGAK